jgi:hypothetical protein
VKLNIPLPEFDQETRDFHHKHCGNHKYMIDAMMLHPEVWGDCAKVAQLTWLEAMTESPNKYVIKRLIQRYHALACKKDVALFWRER